MSISHPVSDARRRGTIEHILNELRAHTRREADEYHSFICRQDLVKVWSNTASIHTLLQPDILSPEDVDRIQRDFIAILSILVTIDATACLAQFRRTFLDGEIGDRDLPFTKERIQSFFSEAPASALLFHNNQWKFCPVKIRSSRHHPLQEVPYQCRLPFQSTPRKLGSGGFGVVNLVEVAPRYLKLNEGADFPYPYKVACKRFQRVQKLADFTQEIKNLNRLKDALTEQKHILQHLAAIHHGPYHYILFPYAENGDLYQFLLDGNGAYDPRDKFPHLPEEGDSLIFKPLLYQCWALASALRWLHGSIQVGTDTFLFAHMDIKPENILIMKDESSVVGKWVISDFGVSVQKPALEMSHLSPEKTIETEPIRPRGTYLPPEAIRRGTVAARGQTVGRKGDIWSYGCVFSEILAWAIGRGSGVEEFSNSRIRENSSDNFWEQGKSGSLTPEPNRPRLRESVVKWLNSLPSPSSAIVVRVWAESIQQILDANVASRPSAERLESLVKTVYNSCDVPTDDDRSISRSLIELPRPGDSSSDDSFASPPGSPDDLSVSEGGPQNPVTSHFDTGFRIQHNDMYRILHYNKKDNMATCLSRTMWQGRVPTAFISQDNITIIELDLYPGSFVVSKIVPLRGEWKEYGAVIEGRYLAAWGVSKRDGKNMLYIGDFTTNLDAMPLVDVRFVTSVAVSPQGLFALVQDQYVVLVRGTPVQGYSMHRRLCGSPGLDQTFTQAVFNDGGDLLFTWARCSKQESLYVWRVTDEMQDQPDFVVHYSLQQHNSRHTEVIPYSSRPGCLLAAVGLQAYLALSLNHEGTELPRIWRSDQRLDIVRGCMVGDSQLLGIADRRHFGTGHLHLKMYSIAQENDMGIISSGEKLCKLPRECKSSTALRAYLRNGTMTAVVCSKGRLIIIDVNDI
ncbi:kinase-like protein [Aspergillus heteromorphus CBS 117.55]|uniref:Kinase-like protein n=1 Tax=Aspergillus heteromorphus CBS 117.55 TaxID=1448321 RepID=A0A317V2F8_9EURO|nr:kinase-like protein [Aspergillus heteromorphus CBS 117.55]PWY68484.1 kinase-like protein [Aspergillus heteromorphus CBS 117.55]